MFFSIRHFIHFNSSVNRLITYKIKVFLYILYIYICLCCVYLICVYINIHTCMYIFQKICYVYILNIFIINMNYMNINIYI